MKYDVPLYLDENNSLGKLLKKIKKESVVLEFGCANGRMTKFMKEELHCKVYIVEYEFEAFQEALNYAENGICSNIMKFEWIEKFQKIKFDYIIFADVLEHLSNPKYVLQETKKLLKEDGRVLVSLPNVAHNDILINLYNDMFNYTSTGLLDDTHIHLFGKGNIKGLCEEAGYRIVSQEYTYCKTGESEQALGLNVPNELKKLLTFRRYGKVYQFVLELMKDENTSFSILDEEKQGVWNEIKIYYNRGQGYNEKETDYIENFCEHEGSFFSQFELNNLQNVEQLYIEPIQGGVCIFKNIEIYSESGETLTYHCPDEVKIGDNELILSYMPRIQLDLKERNIKNIHVKMQVIHDVKEVFTWLCEEYIVNKEVKSKKGEMIKRLEKKNLEIEERREQEKILFDRIQKELWQVSGELVLETEKIEKLEIINQEQKKIMEKTQKEMQEILGSTSWKITKPFRYIMNTMRKIL